MEKTSLSNAQREELIELLEKRLSIISDTHLRESNPELQLRELQSVSEGIVAFHRANRDAIPVRLNHFLENCSFEKALAWAREER